MPEPTEPDREHDLLSSFHVPGTKQLDASIPARSIVHITEELAETDQPVGTAVQP